MKKQRRNLTLSVDSNAVLDDKENASEYVDALVTYARAFGLPETASDLRKAVVDRARGARETGSWRPGDPP